MQGTTFEKKNPISLKVRSKSFVKMESFGVVTFIFCVVLICLIFDFEKERLSMTEAGNSRKHIFKMK